MHNGRELNRDEVRHDVEDATCINLTATVSCPDGSGMQVLYDGSLVKIKYKDIDVFGGARFSVCMYVPVKLKHASFRNTVGRFV
jgi:hypothetical protein